MRLDPIDQQKGIARDGTFARVLVAGPEQKSQARNLFGLREDRFERPLCDLLVAGLEIPGLYALQILVEAPGETKRLCDEPGYVQRGGAACALSTRRGSSPACRRDRQALR